MIGWIDLTVPDAEKIRDFYRAVAGWRSDPVDMGGYSDYTMRPTAGGDPVSGICHKQGVNAQLPPVWMIYIAVADLEASAARCRELGGKVLIDPQSPGHGFRYALIQDPAGAICALYQPA
jgi:predicted enzyme related to lactoylglutathione lyase